MAAAAYPQCIPGRVQGYVMDVIGGQGGIQTVVMFEYGMWQIVFIQFIQPSAYCWYPVIAMQVLNDIRDVVVSQWVRISRVVFEERKGVSTFPLNGKSAIYNSCQDVSLFVFEHRADDVGYSFLIPLQWIIESYALRSHDINSAEVGPYPDIIILINKYPVDDIIIQGPGLYASAESNELVISLVYVHSVSGSDNDVAWWIFINICDEVGGNAVRIIGIMLIEYAELILGVIAV